MAKSWYLQGDFISSGSCSGPKSCVQEGVPALTVEQPEEGMAVLKQVAEEKKVSSPWDSLSDSHLNLRKASSFTVVERIPEMDEIKLGMVWSR